MSFKSRKTNDLINSTMEDDRGRSSVFDRLGAKQLSLQQNYQNRSNSSKLQQAKYEPSDFSDSSTLYDSYKLNSDNKKINEGASSYNKNFYNQDNYDLSFQNEERFFKTKKNQMKKLDNFSESEKHSLKNKHDKIDSDYLKKNYIDQNSELLEKRRIELTRELQKIDQRDKKLVLNKHRHQKNILKSPCSDSSISNCSSSTSSGSDSYSESSGSCSSSCSSSSFSDEAGVSHHKHKNRSKKNTQNQKKAQNFLIQEEISLGNKQSHLKKKSLSPFSKMNKKIRKDPSLDSMQNYNSVMSKKIRSRSPQSTASSYYSRKSRGPLTPPPPSIHHSHQSQQPININASTSMASDNVKLDRHGNIRVSLKEKERQRKINEMQQQINTSPLYSSSQSLNHSKTRSPSKSKEDLYLISEDKKRIKDSMNAYYKENTPSPVHFKHETKARKINSNLNNFEDYKISNYDDNQRFENRPTSSFLYKQSSSRQKNDNNQARLYSINYDKSESNPYISPSDNRYSHYPQTPPNTFNKNKELEKKVSRMPDFNYSHENVNQNKNFVKTITYQKKSNNEDIQYSRNSNLAHNSKNYNSLSKSNDYVNNYLSRVSISSLNSDSEKNLKKNNQKYQEILKNSELSKKSLEKKSENLIIKELGDQVDEISSISNNSLEDVDVSLDDASSIKNENTSGLKDENKIELEKKNDFIDEKSNDKTDNIDVLHDKANKNESKLKNDEFFSDENLSEWSDVEDYDTLNNEDFEQKNIVQSKNIDQFDDLKVKIEEELEAISDEEFDAIIDEQDLENEKNGYLSCKQVLDQLNIDWGSLVQRDLDDEKVEDFKSSASIRFKPARILSQIGISKKYIDENLFKKIKKFCGDELNDEKFDFESPIAMMHLIKKKKNRESPFSNLDVSLNSSCYSDFYDVELRKFLSNGNVFERTSFNHLIKKLN